MADEIPVEGHLDERWASWFNGLRLTHHGDGTTVFDGPVVDQAALHGVLTRLRDLGLPLRCMRQVPPSPVPPAPTTPEPAARRRAGPPPDGNQP